MTLFGVIWAITIIYCFSKKDIKYMLLFTLLFMTFQCTNVLYISAGKGVGPQVLTSFFFIVKVLVTLEFKLKKRQIDKTRLAKASLLAVLLIVVTSSIMNGIWLEKILYIFQLGIYVLTFFLMMRASKLISRSELYSIIRFVIMFVVIVGVIQWLLTMFFPSGKILLKYILYNDSNEDVYFNFNDYFHNRRIYSTFMEPSYMAAFAVGAFYYLLSFWNERKKNLWLLALLLTIIIVSFSSTAYGAFGITGLLFISSTKEIKRSWKIVIIFVGCIGLLLFAVSFRETLDAVLFSKSLTGSATTRARWNNEAFDAFLTSPLWGIGYKAIRGSSIVYSLLGEIGLLGFFSFLVFNVSSTWRAFVRRNESVQYTRGYYGTVYAVIASFICLIIACPDLDLCSYWLWLYLLACYSGQELIIYKRKRLFKYKYGIQNRLRYKKVN